MTPNEQTAVEALKPCPHCGCSEREHDYGQPMIDLDSEDVTGRWFVGCHGCGARSGLYSESSKAVESWNRRTVEPRAVSCLDDYLKKMPKKCPECGGTKETPLDLISVESQRNFGLCDNVFHTSRQPHALEAPDHYEQACLTCGKFMCDEHPEQFPHDSAVKVTNEPIRGVKYLVRFASSGTWHTDATYHGRAYGWVNEQGDYLGGVSGNVEEAEAFVPMDKIQDLYKAALITSKGVR